MNYFVRKDVLVAPSLASVIVFVEVLPWTLVYSICLLVATWLLLTSPRATVAFLRYFWPLLAIFALGGIVSLFSGGLDVEAVKGAYYTSRPLVFLAIGFCLHRRGILTFDVFRSSIILAAVALAVIYIFKYTFNIGDVSGDRHALRSAVGVGYITIAVGASLIVAELMSLRIRLVSLAILPLLLLAVHLSDSRSAYFVILMMLVCFYLHQLVSPIAAVSLMAALLVATTPLIELVFDGDFLRRSFALLPPGVVELISIQRITDAEVNVGWRGFETYRAFTFIWQEGFATQVLGAGWHTQVPTLWRIKLGAGFLNEIPVFHNAWSFLFVRSGYLGLALFFLQILIWSSLFRYRLAVGGQQVISAKKFAFGLLLVLLVTIPSIASIYNPGATGEILCIFLGYCVGFTRFRDEPRAVPSRSPQPLVHPSQTVLGAHYKPTA